MTLQAVIVLVLLGALVIPVIAAEVGRRGRRPVAKPARPVKVEPALKTPLRLVVNKNDMDRELAALLAEDSRKPTERDDK